MIARIWQGVVRMEDADEYAAYIRDTGFTEYAETSGNRGAWMLRRDAGDRTEFITLSLWDSLDAIRAFAGDDIEAAVLYPEDARYLLGESTVTHYQVVDQVEGPLRPRRGTIALGLDRPIATNARRSQMRTRTNLLFTRQRPTVRGVLACDVLAAQVGCGVQPVRSRSAE